MVALEELLEHRRRWPWNSVLRRITPGRALWTEGEGVASAGVMAGLGTGLCGTPDAELRGGGGTVSSSGRWGAPLGPCGEKLTLRSDSGSLEGREGAGVREMTARTMAP